jgi:heme exporter protein B
MTDIIRAGWEIAGRDLRLALRRAGDTVAVVTFFVIAIVLFPLGVGPELSVLARIASGTIWVAALLAAMLSLDRLFLADHDDGSLDLMLLAPVPLEVVVLAKCAAHWLTTGVPLIVAAPLLAVLMNFDFSGLGALILAMALGTPTLSLVGAVGAALTVGVRRGGALVPLLVLPLVIPVLIFGVAAIDLAVMGADPSAPLMVLGGILLAALVLAPWAGAAALRLSAE